MGQRRAEADARDPELLLVALGRRALLIRDGVGSDTYPCAMTNWGARLGVFDLETTGVDVDSSRIVSACIAVLDDEGAVVARWDWLADPGIEIPAGASAVHGITTERARAEGRTARTVVAEIAQTLRVLFATGVPVVVYNAPYDLSLLDRECRRHGLEPIEAPGPIIDPLVIDKSVDRYRKGKRTLEVTAALYSVPLDDAHDAGSDAIAAGRVALALLRTFLDELDIPLEDPHGRQEIWYAEHAGRFQDYHPLGEGRPRRTLPTQRADQDAEPPDRPTHRHPTSSRCLPPRPGETSARSRIEARRALQRRPPVLVEGVETIDAGAQSTGEDRGAPGRRGHRQRSRWAHRLAGAQARHDGVHAGRGQDRGPA